MCVNMKSFFMLGHSDTVVKVELELVANIVSMRIFGHGLSQLQSLSTQQIFA